MAKLNLNYSENVREKIMVDQEKKIAAMYGELAEKVRIEANSLEGVNNSGAVNRLRLRGLGNQLEKAQKTIASEIEGTIKKNIGTVAKAVVQDNLSFFKKIKFEVQAAFSHVPDDVVRSIVYGSIYDNLPDGSKWTLSKAIWQDSKKFKVDIQTVIAQGVAQNKSTFAIAKDIEKYVNPKAKKPWDWSKVYPGTRKKVDYNAQRLARTMVSHGYQQSMVTTTKNNPFVEGYIWHSVFAHGRTCEICKERDGQFYEKGKLPLDHPNGLCYWDCQIPELNSVADRLADWVNGKKDRQLDTFAKSINRATGEITNDLKKNGSILD